MEREVNTMAYQRRISSSVRAGPGREAQRTWWFDVPRKHGSPMRVRIIEDRADFYGAPAEYRWHVDCPHCGIGAGAGSTTSAGRAETAARHWAQDHDR